MWSHWKLIIWIVFAILFELTLAQSQERILSRRTRYVVFPEGSSFSIALCMTVHTLTPDNIFTEGLNWGISYDLPNETKPALAPFLQSRKDFQIPSKHDYEVSQNQNIRNRHRDQSDNKKYYYTKLDYDYVKRQYRRELYNKLEVIMNAMGFSGRTCILRALCEASQRFALQGNTLIQEILRIIFSLPVKTVLLSHEPVEHHIYTKAYHAGYNGGRCEHMFAECTFSLIDMALGKYNGNTDYGYAFQPDVPAPEEDLNGNSAMGYRMK